MKTIRIIFSLVLLELIFSAYSSKQSTNDSDKKPEILKSGTIDVDLVETTPIVFKNKLYRYEYVRAGYWDNQTGDSYSHFVDHETGMVTKPFAKGFHLGSAFVHKEMVYVTAVDIWDGEEVHIFASKDMENWESWIAFKLPGYGIFNTSLTYAKNKFVLMFEIGKPKEKAGERFTANFATSPDLKTWEILSSEHNYAKDRYTAPHCLRYHDGYFYNFYLEAHEGYEMRVVRSKDLINWEASPLNPVLKASVEDKIIANDKLSDELKQRIGKAENRNNSDIDFCEFKGELVINYSWGNQRGEEFLAEAIYKGTQEQFLKGWFPDSAIKTDKNIDLSKEWRFSPDENDIGTREKWFATNFDDSQWKLLDAGIKWEEQGYPDLDSYGWYRKSVEIPGNSKGKDVWLKFGGVNDAYTLYLNGEKLSFFGEANISVASRPTFTEISKNLNYGGANQITVQVNDWGGSGGLWRLPVIITSDENEVSNFFRPISSETFIPEKSGYKLFWQDNFDGDELNPEKWEPRGVGPRAAGYVSRDAIKVKDGFLELAAFIENDSLKVGAIGTQNTFMTKYGYFECRAQLQKSKGNWSAFWIQSPGIAKGEDTGEFGTEIDIFEYFKKSGDDMVSHNLHWAYGPNQKSIGGLLSQVEGIGEGFHTFGVEWTPEKYTFYINGYKYYEVTQAISHTEEYMILSMELPGTIEDMKDAALPDVYRVDYVKVYKRNK
jgi:hypothetical protein